MKEEALNRLKQQLFLSIYDQAFRASGMEVFNKITEEITTFLNASATSLWIKHIRVAESETRLGYYQSSPSQDLGRQDYKVTSRVFYSGEATNDQMIDSFGNTWYYRCQPFQCEDTAGCYCIWFETSSQDDFSYDFWVELGEKLGLITDRLLKCARFDCQRILKELTAAEKMQSSLLPAKLPEIPGISLGFRNLMANEVGGDYLDIFTLKDKRLGIVVGDALGKGIPGAFTMLTTRSVFRFLVRANLEPDVLMSQVNLCLAPELISQNMLVTLFYGIYNPEDMTFQYTVAGHNPPVIFRKQNRQYGILLGKGLVIGGKSSTSYKTYTTSFNKGDILIVYSDGLKDAKNSEQKPFGVERIGETIRNYSEYDAEAISDCLAHKLMHFCGNKLGDDISFVVLKVE